MPYTACLKGGIVLLAWLYLLVPTAWALSVEVVGTFGQPGLLQLEEGARLSEALTKGRLLPEACQLQGALMRSANLPDQERLKKGLLYDLEALAYVARLEGHPVLAAWAGRMRGLVQGQPVTGRQLGQVMERGRLLMRLADDLPLQEGDRILYPPCARTLYALGRDGLVALAHDPALSLEDYLKQLPRADWQAPGYLWVVHSDGHYERLRIGYWYGGEPRHPEPAAVIFRPLSAHWAALVNPDFNRDLARWFATRIPDGRAAARIAEGERH